MHYKLLSSVLVLQLHVHFLWLISLVTAFSVRIVYIASLFM